MSLLLDKAVRGCLAAIAVGNVRHAEVIARRHITPGVQDPTANWTEVHTSAYTVIRALISVGSEDAIERANSLERVIQLCTPKTSTFASDNSLEFREAEAREYDRGFVGT